MTICASSAVLFLFLFFGRGGRRGEQKVSELKT